MKKELIRRKFFKLKLKGHSYNQCRKIIKSKYDYVVHNRILQRWMNKLDKLKDWDLRDTSTKPKIIRRRISLQIEEKIISIKNKTGWRERLKILLMLGILLSTKF